MSVSFFQLLLRDFLICEHFEHSSIPITVTSVLHVTWKMLQTL